MHTDVFKKPSSFQRLAVCIGSGVQTLGMGIVTCSLLCSGSSRQHTVAACCYRSCLFIWKRRSSGAVPFATMFSLLVLGFGFSVPLVFLGAYFAVQGKPVELPVRTNHIPRHIPEQQFVTSPCFCVFSVALCHFVLCTRNCSSSCLSCNNNRSIISSICSRLSSRLLILRALRCQSR